VTKVQTAQQEAFHFKPFSTQPNTTQLSSMIPLKNTHPVSPFIFFSHSKTKPLRFSLQPLSPSLLSLKSPSSLSSNLIWVSKAGVSVCRTEHHEEEEKNKGVSLELHDLSPNGEVYQKTLQLVECSMFAALTGLVYFLSNSLAIEVC